MAVDEKTHRLHVATSPLGLLDYPLVTVFAPLPSGTAPYVETARIGVQPPLTSLAIDGTNGRLFASNQLILGTRPMTTAIEGRSYDARTFAVDLALVAVATDGGNRVYVL